MPTPRPAPQTARPSPSGAVPGAASWAAGRTGSSPARSLHTLQYVLGADPAVVRGFAQAAAERFEHGPLTLDARDRLLRRGERLGLRRFDANLVLAAVEQRRTPPRPASAAAANSGPGPARTTGVAASAPPLRLVWSVATAALALQATIAAGAWWLLA